MLASQVALPLVHGCNSRTVKEKVNWGILGCARIAKKCVIPAFAASTQSKLIAIASRDLDKARTWAQDFGVSQAYGSYEELLAREDIDAVYIPLPNSMHPTWVKAAAEAGKHVLCEKPFSASADEAFDMLQTCKRHGVRVHEAFMWRFHPRTKKILDLVREGRLGTIRLIRGCFSYQIADAPNIRLLSNLAGGALMDVGCYCVNFSRLMMQAEPVLVSASMQYLGSKTAELHAVDLATSAVMEFPGGAAAMFSSRFDTSYDGQWMEIIGTKGKLYVDHPFNPPSGKLHVLLNQEVIECENTDHFQRELDEFSLAVLNSKSSNNQGRAVNPLVDEMDAYRQAKVIEALYASARQGKHIVIK